MLHQAFWLNSTDAAPLYVNRWYAEQPPKALLMVAHGMAEHSGRYARLAEALVAQGFLWALMIGLLGGLLPALRAARLPVTAALRG